MTVRKPRLQAVGCMAMRDDRLSITACTLLDLSGIAFPIPDR